MFKTFSKNFLAIVNLLTKLLLSSKQYVFQLMEEGGLTPKLSNLARYKTEAYGGL